MTALNATSVQINEGRAIIERVYASGNYAWTYLWLGEVAATMHLFNCPICENVQLGSILYSHYNYAIFGQFKYKLPLTQLSESTQLTYTQHMSLLLL